MPRMHGRPRCGARACVNASRHRTRTPVHTTQQVSMPSTPALASAAALCGRWRAFGGPRRLRTSPISMADARSCRVCHRNLREHRTNSDFAGGHSAAICGGRCAGQWRPLPLPGVPQDPQTTLVDMQWRRRGDNCANARLTGGGEWVMGGIDARAAQHGGGGDGSGYARLHSHYNRMLSGQ